MARILVDITHPAHVHFFKNPITILRDLGHSVFITSRDKDCTVDLLDSLGFDHDCLSKEHTGKLPAMLRELVMRDAALVRKARNFKPDVLVGLGGIFAAHAAKWLGVPSVVFYDTENATLQNALTYPFATRVVVPECYESWTPRGKTLRYKGFHELSYLHSTRFQPSRETALKNGLSTDGDTFLIRVVAWKANHDVNERGWSPELLAELIHWLRPAGKVIVSAEGALPPQLEQYRYTGDPQALHHLLAFCRASIGESATLASESAMLGVPAVYAAETSRGYINQLDADYGLVRSVTAIRSGELLSGVQGLLSTSPAKFKDCHDRLMNETVDVAQFVADTILDVTGAR